VVAYECLTGIPPFLGQTLAALGVAIHDGRFQPVSAAGGPEGPMLDAFFARAFARDVGARFQSARELADAFQAAAGVTPPRLSFVPSGGPVSAFSRTASVEPTLHPFTMGEAPKPPPQAFTSAATTTRIVPRRGASLAAVAGVLLLVAAGIAVFPVAAFLRRRADVQPLPATAQAATAGATTSVEGAGGPAPSVEPGAPVVDTASTSTATTATSAPPPVVSSAPKSAPPRPTATATATGSGKSKRRDHGF
jgi:serine/threonine-protein kinase